MDGEGRSAEADQSGTKPWKGKRGKSGVSKETNASSSVRRTQHDQGKERALQGVSNLEKMAQQTTTGPEKRDAYEERNYRDEETEGNLTSIHSVSQPHQSLCILLPSQENTEKR